MAQKKKPEFLTRFWERELQSEKGLEGYWSKQLNKAMYKVATTNLATLDRDMLKQIAKPIIREVNKRMRLLEEANMQHTPAYTFLTEELGRKRPSAAGTNRNVIINNIRLAYDFLHAKTSIVSNAAQYDIWLDEHIGMGLNTEEKAELWSIIHDFESSHTQRFYNYNYDETIRKISAAYHATGRDAEATRQAFYDYLENEGIIADMERGTGEELKGTGISPWWPMNNSMRGL